jgi:hypothetical protein
MLSRYWKLVVFFNNNLGEMIGVKYNQDKDWVGGTIGLFER